MIKLSTCILLAVGFLTAPLAIAAGEKIQQSSIRALLVPRVESTISSQLSARINKIAFENGDRFKKGDVLLAFDCSIYNALRSKANAELKVQRETLKANRDMQQHNAISELEVGISDAKVKIARAEKSLADVRAGYCNIKAPYNGRVVKVYVNPYESISEGDKLLDVLDDSRLKMRVNVPSAWVIKLKIGSSFEVRMDETGKSYPAKVTALGARVNPVSQTFEITAEIDGEFPELISGMSGEATFK